MNAEEQKLLEARLADCVRLGEKRPAFLGFLDLSERAEAEAYLRHIRAENWMFFGGWPDAERVMLGVFPDYLAPDASHFPLLGLTVSFRKQDTLSHRDFLGSFLAQGVVRASLGDILVEEGRAVLFVKTELAPHFLSQIEKIGRVGVRIREGFDEPLPAAHTFGGFVSINHRETLSAAARVHDGDVISIRRCGRFIIDALGPKTKKGRLSIRCRKYI